MYRIFRRVLPLLLFQSALLVDSASDNDSFKKSLGHVSRFLENVGQSIQNEKFYVDTVTREKSNTPRAVMHKSPVKNDGNTKNINNDKEINPNNPLPTHINTITSGKPNHVVLDSEKGNKLGSTETTKGNEKNKLELYKIAKVKGKNEKRKEGRESDADVFGDMVFPPKSDMPKVDVNVPKRPETIIPDFTDIIQGGPDAGTLSNPTTTTQINEILLDPKDYGFSTTHKPIPTYGDFTGSVHIRPDLFTTTKPPSAFMTAFKNDMSRLGMGVFSAALLKMFHWVIYKKPEDVRRIAFGFGRLVEHYYMQDKLDSFGQPTKHAFMYTSAKASAMPADERRSQAILLHDALQRRWNMLSEETNSILDHIDSLYLKEEANDLINSMELLEMFTEVTVIPYTLLETFLQSVLAPWERLKDTSRGQTLKENLNRAIKTRFYPDIAYYPGSDPIRNAKNQMIPARKHNTNEKINIAPNKNDNVMKNKKGIEMRNFKDKNIKIIRWIPNFTYRTGDGKKIEKTTTIKTTTKDYSDNYEDDSIEKEYEGLMSAITEQSRTVTTRPRDQNVNQSKKKDVEKKSDKSEDIYKDEYLEVKQQQTTTTTTTTTTTATKKHHRKRHSRHRHKHSISTRGLAKLLKIIKYLRPHHKRDKHKKRHHKFNKRRTRFRAVSSDDDETNRHKDKTNRRGDKTDKDKDKTDDDSEKELSRPRNKMQKRNKFYFEHGKKTTYVVPLDEFYKYSTLAHVKKKLSFRRNMIKNIESKKDFRKLVIGESDGSDEEILLKMNLLKAMGGQDGFDDFLRRSKKGLLDESSCSTDEETILKSQIYKYFNSL